MIAKVGDTPEIISGGDAKQLSYTDMLAGIHLSEGKKQFSDYGKADPATYNGITLNAMQASDDENFRKITSGQMRAMGGVIHFAKEFKKNNNREIDLNKAEDLAAYNEWSAKKTNNKVEALKAETVQTLSEENINNFYVKNYFDKAGISNVKHSGVQYVLFDMSVNFGIGSESKNNGMKGILERTLSKHFPNAKGNDIFEKANNVDAKQLIVKIGEERINSYDRIIKSNPLKAQFRNGWMNRTERVTQEALSGEIVAGGALPTVRRFSSRNKTYGISGVADEDFFDTEPSFWKSILNLFKGVLEGLAKLFTPADGIKLVDDNAPNANARIPYNKDTNPLIRNKPTQTGL